MGKTKKEFKERILNKPIVISEYCKTIFPTKQERGDIVMKEFLPRMEALYKEYDLPYETEKYGHQLAYCLAMKYIFEPNMIMEKPTQKKGRPQKWKGIDGISLFLRVTIKVLEKDGRSLREALSLVMKEMNIPDKKLNATYVRLQEIMTNPSPKNAIVIEKIIKDSFMQNDKLGLMKSLKQMLSVVEQVKKEIVQENK